jgi:hypothetical protein
VATSPKNMPNDHERIMLVVAGHPRARASPDARTWWVGVLISPIHVPAAAWCALAEWTQRDHYADQFPAKSAALPPQ